MKVCLDTNVFAQLFNPQPPFPQILDAFIHGRFEIVVSTEILLEYEEVVVREFGSRRWTLIWALVGRVNRLHNSVKETASHFRFQVISVDPDDNKFVDCAIAARAELLVTSDRHFHEVLNSGYAVRVVDPNDFAQLL